MTPTRALTITVSEGLYGRFVEMARKQGMTPPFYGKLLFEAAYSARCGMTGDRALDAAVAAIGSADAGAIGSADAGAIGVEKPAARVEADAETELLRSQLQESLEQLEQRDATIAQLRREIAAGKKSLQTMEVDSIEMMRQEAGLDEDVAAAERQRDEHMISLGAAEERIAELQARINQLNDGIETRDAAISGLERRIAEADAPLAMLRRDRKIGIEHIHTGMPPREPGDPVREPQFYKGLAEEAAEMGVVWTGSQRPAAQASETVEPAKNHKLTEMPDAPAALAPDQVKRARTYHGYGMSAADIAAAMQVDVAVVQAALGRAA
jgi:DNA-binding transcriptional regulator YiaG